MRNSQKVYWVINIFRDKKSVVKNDVTPIDPSYLEKKNTDYRLNFCENYATPKSSSGDADFVNELLRCVLRIFVVATVCPTNFVTFWPSK